MLRMLKLLQEFGRDVSPGLVNSVESRKCNIMVRGDLQGLILHMKRIEKVRLHDWHELKIDAMGKYVA
ncbi:hypothetical protein Lser_V15G03508 [Lactuca serriola]